MRRRGSFLAENLPFIPSLIRRGARGGSSTVGHLGKDGFTLLELIMVIVIIAIVMPVVLMPIVTGSKNISTPVDASGIAAIGRKHLDEEIAALDVVRLAGTWPAITAVAADPAVRTFTDTLNGRTYTTTITERYCDASNTTSPLFAAPCSNTTAIVAPATASTANNYLVVTVTTTSSERGNNVTFETIKTRNY